MGNIFSQKGKGVYKAKFTSGVSSQRPEKMAWRAPTVWALERDNLVCVSECCLTVLIKRLKQGKVVVKWREMEGLEL